MSSYDFRSVLSTLPLFSRLGNGQLEHLAGAAVERHLTRGEFLFYRGDPCVGLFGVVSGMMQLSIANVEGAEKVVEIIHAGESFGEAVMFLDRPYPVDAVALAPTELVYVPSATVHELLDRDPVFARSMLASMASRLHTMVHDVEMYTLRSATERVVAFFVGELGDRLDSHDAARVVLRSTKQVLASRLGLSPETFSRVMRDLADQGLVFVQGRRIVIPDPPALVAFID